MSSIGISSVGSPYQSYASSNRAQQQQAFQSLADSLNSNDLQGAQQAFAALQKASPQAGGNQGNSSNSTSNNPLATDLQNLSQALSQGDLGTAQSAFAKLQQDLQLAQGGHHHHHGGSGIPAGTPATSANTANSGATDSDGDHDGSTGQKSLNVQA